MTEYGRFLREIRVNSGLTINKAAKLIGISGQYLSEVERGGRKPLSNDITAALVENIGISRDDADKLLSLRNIELSKVPVPEEVTEFLLKNPNVVSELIRTYDIRIGSAA